MYAHWIERKKKPRCYKFTSFWVPWSKALAHMSGVALSNARCLWALLLPDILVICCNSLFHTVHYYN